MTKLECLSLLREVRADYVATLRDCNRLRTIKHIDPSVMPLVQALDKGIADLTVEVANAHIRQKEAV